jgi:hypothetical protein
MLEPEQVCLVAPHNADLAAARRCGLRTAFIPRPTEHGPGQSIDLGPEEDWDAVASDLMDLADQLGVRSPRGGRGQIAFGSERIVADQPCSRDR